MSMVEPERLARAWAMAWKIALVTGVTLASASMALSAALDVPAPAFIVPAGALGLLVGCRLPAARPAMVLRRG
jgi:hypothetical protein